jgi:ABC-type branched-subunit amino acid transport system substrate-binding protein
LKPALHTLLAAIVMLSVSVSAQTKKYDVGVTDTEIKIGQTMPYSGAASAYATVGRAHTAYFEMINAQGGINGRKIKLISLDDAMTPPRAVEQVRKLVEDEQVFITFGILGVSNFAVQKYLNAKKVPHLFPSAASLRFHDPKNYPWTMGWVPSFDFEGRLYARYILANKPDAKIAVIYLNDDLGKEYLRGFKEGLGDKAARMIVAEASFELTDATVDSQIVTLHASGADTLFTAAIPKFGSQTIRKVYDLGWKPLHIVIYPAGSVGATLKPAGLDKSVGLLTSYFGKDLGTFDSQSSADPEVQEFLKWRAKYLPDADPSDGAYGYAYMQAALMVEVLKRCGNELTRENVMHQATNLKNLRVPMFLDGIMVNTSPTDFRPIKQMRMLRFDGQRWNYFGPIMTE